MNMQHTLVVGIGSPHGDDQAGWLVAEGLAAVPLRGRIDVRKARSPTNLLDWVQDVARLVICDACHGLGRAGEVRRFSWPAPELQEATWSGTHDLSLPAVLSLAQRLGRLPDDIVVWAVEGAAGEAETPLSVEVHRSVPDLISQIASELNGEISPTSKTCTSSH